MKSEFSVPSSRRESSLCPVLQRDCKECISHSSLVSLQDDPWCAPTDLMEWEHSAEWGDEGSKNLHGVLGEILEYLFTWLLTMALHFLDLEKTVTNLLRKFCLFVYSLCRIWWNSCVFSAITISSFDFQSVCKILCLLSQKQHRKILRERRWLEAEMK